MTETLKELYDEEQRLRNKRIDLAISMGGLGGYTGVNTADRCMIAQLLYEAKWNCNSYIEAEEMTPEQILDTFCWNLFGCSVDEVIIAWDRYLG